MTNSQRTLIIVVTLLVALGLGVGIGLFVSGNKADRTIGVSEPKRAAVGGTAPPAPAQTNVPLESAAPVPPTKVAAVKQRT